MKRDLKLFINDIINSIEDIESFIKGISKESFLKNKEKQNAIIKSIEIIGEATKNIPSSFRNKYPNIEWGDIAGFRDVMVHSYFVVDLDKVWNVIKDDLPKLKKEIKKIEKDISI